MLSTLFSFFFLLLLPSFLPCLPLKSSFPSSFVVSSALGSLEEGKRSQSKALESAKIACPISLIWQYPKLPTHPPPFLDLKSSTNLLCSATEFRTPFNVLPAAAQCYTSATLPPCRLATCLSKYLGTHQRKWVWISIHLHLHLHLHLQGLDILSCVGWTQAFCPPSTSTSNPTFSPSLI